MIFNKEQVKSFLPHRDPFLFIHEVESVECSSPEVNSSKDLVGTKVTAHFYVDERMKVLEGHFPGRPIVPGVVQIEMMAQACAFSSLPLVKDRPEDYDAETLLLGAQEAKFRSQLTPGMKLTIKTHMTKCRAQVASYDCVIECDGKKVSEASILAKLDIKKKEGL